MKRSKHENTPERQLGWDMDKSSYLRAGAETGQNTDTPHEDQASMDIRTEYGRGEVINDDIVIKVIGVGGGGGNVINTMVANELTGVEFIAANTDMQALNMSLAPRRLQLGSGVTKGLGAGADPDRGREAAQESYEELLGILDGANMVFITAGLGGGTGTGALPVIARACKEVGALTVAVVSKPFCFEGKKRMKNAEAGWDALREHADTIITVPNDRLLTMMNKNSTMSEMLEKVDHVLLDAVRGITDVIKVHGQINLDFEDLRTVMREVGPAIMGTGVASGEKRAVEAARTAIDNQLLEDVGIDGARGVLVNVSAARETLTLTEWQEAMALIQEKAHEDANIILGVIYDDSLGEEMRVTVIATGISSREEVETPVRSPRHSVIRLGSRRTSFDDAPARTNTGSSFGFGNESQARPNPLPTGLTPMPATSFDDDGVDEDELEKIPTYVRRNAN